MNRLYYGDCLTIMRDHMKLGSVDLIYLDPPFKSNRDYNAIYKDETGRPLPDQLDAFCDTWVLNEESERTIQNMPILIREAKLDDEIAEFWRLWVNALRNTNPSLLAYLSYMVARLLLMKGILKPTGSIYLHCDHEAVHYIKVMMDAIFGHKNFNNEIVWRRTNAHPLGARKFEEITDSLLFYVRGKGFTFHGDTTPMSDGQIDALYDKEDERGRFANTDLTGGKQGGPAAYRAFKGKIPSQGRAWAPPSFEKLPAWAREHFGGGYNKLDQLERCYALDEIGLIYWTGRGTPRLKRYLKDQEDQPRQSVANLWTDIKPAPRSEKMGPETQKPLALLERIITASSKPGDTVFDPFCGCATTLEAAHKLGRQWVGIDIAIHAIRRVAKARLEERLRLVEGEHFQIQGVPRNMEGARDMWSRDKYHFQKWAVEQVDGFVTTRQSGDGGVDGRIYFAMPETDAHKRRPLESMAIEVKGGKNVGINVIRELRGVLDNDQALVAGLIVMEPLGERKERNFRKFMADAGDLDVLGMKYARMQMLTVAEILDGKRFHTPGAVGRVDQAALPLS